MDFKIYLDNYWRMFKFVKKVIVFSAFAVLLFFLLIFSILWVFSSDLPDYKFLSKYEPSVSSRVYAADGQIIAEFALH